MPKMKTNRSAAKRFKVTASGKIKVNKAYRRHILTKKTTKQKRGLRQANYLTSGDAKLVRGLIPYA
ncbi:MAG: 50S ribosomal protein L35 [Myxococcales bacterium]|nr:50S ribosomal protein L35 [Myxococcales bacterium]